MAAGDDTKLRQEIRLFGRLLGEALAELRGPSALALVEEARRPGRDLPPVRAPGGVETR